MNRCQACKNNRRQLLMLKCTHDICIKCAADNYFINCKNKINNKKSRNSSYYCEKCLEQTELDTKTIQTLRNYFMDNVNIDEKQKNNRKEKIIEREVHHKQRIDRINRLDNQNSHRPKSLELEIVNRKRTLSKYLNDKQVEKFIEMQNQYGNKKKSQSPQVHNVKNYGSRNTPQAHAYTENAQSNDYQLNRVEYQNLKKKESPIYCKDVKMINDSFQKFAQRQRLNQAGNDNYQRTKYQKNIPNHQEMEYELYHNGKAVTNYTYQAARLLMEEERQRVDQQADSQYSSPSNKIIGTIRSKKSPNINTEKMISNSPIASKQQLKSGVLVRNQRIPSSKSEQNLDRMNFNNQIKTISSEYNPKFIENSMDIWEIQSKSTKRMGQERTIPHGERNSSETMDKILETLQTSQKPSVLKFREKAQNNEIERVNGAEMPKSELFFCKIHEDEQIIYFCLKCNQLICSQCALHGCHKSHQIHSLKKSAQILHQTLANNMNTLTKFLIEQESKQKILKLCLNQINSQCNKQKQQIRSSFENFIFQVDKKYKEILKDIEERFAVIMNEYTEKLTEAKNNQAYIGKIKDNIFQTLKQYGSFDQEGVSKTNIGAACGQLGNFNVKRPKNKVKSASFGIESINKLTIRIQQLQEFFKNSNILLFSNKKESLLSENSSLKLSESSNLLDEENNDLFPTPETNTPPRSTFPTRVGSPKDRKSKKIVISSYSLNVKSRIKISLCEPIVQSLVQMQDIIKSIKLESFEYQLKALI